MTSLTLLSPVKINGFLHITGQRPDGYHNLQTLFILLDYGDQLTFTPRNDGRILLTPDLPGVSVENNLIYRAARLLADTTGTNPGVDIHLNKQIPMGGGLGGGSSNAATTLLALNQLWQCGLTESHLLSLGRQLGADVPVFIRGRTAWAEGIGEQLTPMALPALWFLVVTPNCPVETPVIFRHQELTRNTPPLKIPASLSGPDLFASHRYHNDCEALVCRLYPEVQIARDTLARMGPTRMTGTGASLFLLADSEAQAREAQSAIQQQAAGKGWRTFVARSLNESPVIDSLKRSTL